MSLLVVDPRVAATLYAATSEGLYRSTDGGVACAPMNRGLRTPAVVS